MREIIVKDFGSIRYVDEGKKDELGQKVVSRYVELEGEWQQDGYLYKRNKKDISKLKTIYGKGVGIQEFVECTLKVI